MSKADAGQVLATLFRRQSGRMTAALVRMLGVGRIDLAEDIVQETLLAALQAWHTELPRDPEGWLFAVMRNRVRDAFRRERVRSRVLDADTLPEETEAEAPREETADESADLLRMMFSCCHPALTDDGRTVLILRLVCGFGTGEVACAFLADRAAMEKRIARAKRIIADDGQLFEVSTREQARERMPAVLTAIYLMFDAGYHGSVVPEPVRADLCADAIRLATLLAASPATASAEVDALLALMYLHAARMPARLDARGALVPLEHQDRSLWDAELITRGMEHLGASARGGEVTTYHLEAGIAALHVMSPSVEATPWGKIADLYERLYARKPTPVVALGRAIARAQVDGPARGIDAILAIPGRERLEDYPFYWAALGDLSLRAGDRGRALVWFQRGSKAARNDAERAMFARRILECVD
ncbi:RNA polymerase sigma-70 factor, ECF subfamily [Labilithrix luteola]|uniref:RNA polymerase sigma-70 factor, ECF subfamily n=1 Tax=Labilithrix luteola TaxID=1391654 RepID=A0A0K1PWY8_9BACT|nr:sigma-70 family RNA polymerase sigma factor [Labilithrix luteola]AKU97891.1 RNA polymerase sigma-70 factor, ECF subfamily [Labilithrix luteola]